MMKKINQKNARILAIAPSARGFGFAVLEGEEKLVDWGVKAIKGDKNSGSLAKIADLIVHYQPGVIVLEDATDKDSRRSVRIRQLLGEIITVAERHDVKVATFSRERIMRAFFVDGEGTKHGLAVLLANRFHEELKDRLPPKRRAWTSEDYRMDIFDAVALAVTKRSNGREA